MMDEQLWSDKRIRSFLGDIDPMNPGWDGALRGMQSVRDDYEQRIADLEQRLAERWQPVPDGTHRIGSGEIDVSGETIGVMGADEVGDDAYATLALDDTHRLCELAPTMVAP